MPRTKMSTSPSFPLGSEYTDRPLSVYDNLSSGPISNGNRDYPKSPNGHPLTNISFQFDHGIGNGSSPSHTVASAQQQSPAAINNNNNNRSSSTSPVKNSKALINVTPEINSDLVVKNGQGFETMNDRAGQLASKSPPRLAAAPVAYSPAKSDAALSNANTIVTTKPVISDAKSKFFGLTSATSDRSASDDLRSESNVPLLRDVQPQYQIVKPPPVNTTAISDHRYQNIPPNSAIFRKLNESAEPAEKISKDIAGPYHHHHHHHHPHHPHDHITIMPDFPVTAATEKSFPENQAINDDDNIRNHSNRSTKSFQADMELNFTQQQPSQVIYMSTTVPQNIKGPNIAGRHTPTRNSLRHSRMLVVNKNYQGLNKTNPLDLKHPRIARILLILLLILGLMITAIGTWILLWAPYTRMQDNPYWSGLSLILAGTLGLIVIKFKRIKRQKIREHCFTFLMVDSLMLTMVACILCLAAFSCASLHLNNLISPNTKCASTNILIANASCTCIFGARDTNFTPPNGTTMQNRTAEFFSGGYEFHYNDLSCSEVNGAWHYLLIISIVLNVLGFFLGSCYLLLACFKKTAKRKIYNTIQTNVF